MLKFVRRNFFPLLLTKFILIIYIINLILKSEKKIYQNSTENVNFFKNALNKISNNIVPKNPRNFLFDRSVKTVNLF